MKKILIIEDEDSIRGFLKINLKRNGFEVLEADNGEEGLKILDLRVSNISWVTSVEGPSSKVKYAIFFPSSLK